MTSLHRHTVGGRTYKKKASDGVRWGLRCRREKKQGWNSDTTAADQPETHTDTHTHTHVHTYTYTQSIHWQRDRQSRWVVEGNCSGLVQQHHPLMVTRGYSEEGNDVWWQTEYLYGTRS